MIPLQFLEAYRNSTLLRCTSGAKGAQTLLHTVIMLDIFQTAVEDANRGQILHIHYGNCFELSLRTRSLLVMSSGRLLLSSDPADQLWDIQLAEDSARTQRHLADA